MLGRLPETAAPGVSRVSSRGAAPVVPLRWALAFGSDPERAGRVVRTWTVSTPVRGSDTLTLVRAEPGMRT